MDVASGKRRSRRFKSLLVTAGASIAALSLAGPAGAAVTGTNDPNSVADAISPGAAGVFTGPVGPTQAGIGDAAQAGFPTAGGTFGVLTSGNAELADDPNGSESDGESLGIQDSSRGNAIDPITLGMAVNAPAGSSCMLVDFKFLSEEFPEFVNSGFNDAFIAEVDKTTWSVQLDPETGQQRIVAPDDFAAGYGDQVSVDTVGPTLVSPVNADGTTYDAGTATITTKTPVAPGQHALFLSVFDAGDGIYDSAVFVDNVRFNAEPPQTCRAADIFGGAVGVQKAGKVVNFNGKTGELDLTCTLPAEATDPCIGNISITAALGGLSRTVAKQGKVAKGTYSVEPASTGEGKVKLTKKGKRLLKRKGKTKAKAKVTNSVNGASTSFKLKLKK